mmetsp:Transcript_4039/g.11466  ORF Transcript_4039/g.11466 Transcript_4039/m.11466 type:complete len:607 (-) Transcript_4039:76-1896(-)
MLGRVLCLHALWVLASCHDVARADRSSGSDNAPQFSDDAADDEFCALQQTARRTDASVGAAALGRVTVGKTGTFELDGQEVVLLGGNYVVKAAPYFPPLDVVHRDAKAMAEGARAMAFSPSAAADGSPRRVVPVVRLGVLFEAAMPNLAGDIDQEWANTLEAVVAAFAAEGVYVFLDIHQDAFSTTNGGEGLPWWMAAHMQETATEGESYIVSPEHPMKLFVTEATTWLLQELGVPVPYVQTVADENGPDHEDPWRAFSVGSNDGNPQLMNLGNPSIRLNNNDAAWSQGTLVQVQNFAHRFWNSHLDESDRKNFFDPYVAFVLHLCRVWERQSNVVAVELFNEPPAGGRPDFIRKAVNTRHDLFGFYGEVLRVLGDATPAVRAPIAIEDLFGTLPDANPLLTAVLIDSLPAAAASQLRKWASQGQLVLSFHFYPGFATTVDFPRMVQLAKTEAAKLGDGVPIWLSEYFAATPQEVADQLASAVELGCNAATFWQYADINYTNEQGWFKYDPEIAAKGGPFDSLTNKINAAAWPAYEETVRNGTFWGGEITGGSGAQMDVLKLVPSRSTLSSRSALKAAAAAAAPGPAPHGLFGHFGHFRQPRVPGR